MDVREKLVELLKEIVAIQECGFGDPRPTYETVASYLMSHGVTVQDGNDNNVPTKWIPGTERLPDFGSRVIACGEKGGVFLVKSEGTTIGFGRMDGTSKYRSFTHWMPLPVPPKGE